MGHKEQLLEGAKRCLLEKGYARTTSRDIVAASGTNLASIGYHYGSKEALLNTAMIAAVGEWTDRMLPRPDADGEPDRVEFFEAVWTRLIDSFESVQPLLAANFEAFTQVARSQELRAQLSEAHEAGRRGLAALMLDVPEEDLDEHQVRTLGSLLMALVPGVIAQFLVDPERTPTGHDLAEGLRILTADPPA